MRRLLILPIVVAAMLPGVAVLAASGQGGAVQVASGAPRPEAVAAAAQAACQEDIVRAALDASGQVGAVGEYELAHLECAEGFGWAVIDPVAENYDTADALLRVTDTDVELLDLGTALCTRDHGIPDEIAELLAPPGRDPIGECGGPAPADPGGPVAGDPTYTG